MTDTLIKLKRSSVPGKIPLAEDLVPGEVAINDFDGTMYYKKADGTIGALGSGGGASDALIQAVATEKAIIMAIALG